ncbi:MAG: serine--tRNA ligase [Candidatus Micrarchaeota archaeon]
MIPLKFLKENTREVKESLKKRGDKEKIKLVDEALKKNDEAWEYLREAQKLRAERNKVSQEINALIKEKQDASKQIKKAKEIPEKIRELEEKARGLQEKTKTIIFNLPNVLHESVPFGKDDSDNQEVRKWGKPKKFGFELKTHEEIAEKLGLADFERAAKISGAGFNFLKGNLVLLDLALQKFAIDYLMKKKFDLIAPPLMMRREPYEGVTDLSDFEQVMYKINEDDEYLIATSEHPLIAMFQNEVINEEELPIKLAGVSSCFRREIGGHGVDSKGLNRMHQFNKIEQVVISKPEDSWKIHEELIKNAEELYQKLELPYRIVNVCTGDLGNVAAKKYDLEVWMPRENKYVETVSGSNCTFYQAARLNIRYRLGKQGAQDEEKHLVHTLNCTAIATSRVLRAILENNQNKDGSVTVPKALQPYFKEKLL